MIFLEICKCTFSVALKDSNVCCKEISYIESFSDEDKSLLRWRSNLWEKMEDTFTVCENHKKKYLYLFNSDGNCTDPFNKHLKKVKNSSVRKLDLQTALNFKKFSKININLPPGANLCGNCRVKVSEVIKVDKFEFL